ncbi:G patch domain-containing protein [Chlorella vulgaris]
MMADEADYKFWGQAIEDEEESRLGQRRKDEVTDEEGRRRFHGAFTGGYSAGYFNTVGSKAGWQPGTFRSSRDSREAVQQSVEQYLDEDELEELRRTNLQTSAEYDTFGSTAAELARRAATDAATERPSAIPGLLPDELVVPVADSVGIRLLQKMGWRLGKGIGVGGDAPTPDDEAAEQQQAGSAGGSGDGATAAAAAATARRKRRWGQHVSVAAENTALHLLAPKTDVHGLGFDPFKAGVGAEDFRRLKEQRQAAARPGAAAAGGGQAGKRRRGIAFGSGALDDENEDGYGAGVTLEDYVTHDDVGDYDAEVEVGAVSRSRAPKLRRSGLGDRLAQKGYSFEIAEEEEEEEQGALEWHQPHRQPQYALPGRAAPLLLHSKEQAQGKSGLVPGFVRATATVAFTYFPPPRLPPKYVPVHRVRQPPPEAEAQRPSAALAPAPPQAPPPDDAELRQAIDSLAFFVARNGLIFENMARQRQEKEGRHAFLSGGLGADYYRWRVHSLRAIIQPQQQQQQRRRKQPLAIGQRSAPLSADERGAMLGEQPLAAATAGAAAAGPEGWATGVPEGQQAAAAAIAAGQAQQALRRQLLQVAEGDRQRLQQLLSRNFVAAETQDMLHPDAKAAAMSGLRPGAPAPPPRLPAGTAAERAAAAAAAAAAGAAPAGAAAEAAGGGLALRVQRPAAQQGPAQRQLPVRRSEEWRPQALLCKRFNVPDPYQGRPAELQMSRFRTDHLVLPDTAAAVASSLTAVPDGAQDFLLPPSVATAIKEAEAKQQLQSMQGSGGGGALAAEQPGAQPQDAAGAADAFLSSLSDMLGGGGGSGAPAAAGDGGVAPPLPPGLPPPLDPLQQQQQQQQEAEAAAREEEEAEEAAAERPVDLFKAIFEDSAEEDEEEEMEEVEAQERQLGQQPAAAALATAGGADLGGQQVGPQQHAQQQQGQHADTTFGFAKLRQQPPLQGRPPPSPPPLPMLPPPPRSGAVPAAAAAAVVEGGLDEATKLRVQEALRALGKGSKRDKRIGRQVSCVRWWPDRCKKKKKGKEKEKERKERKEKKASRHKSSKHKRHSRRGSDGSGSSSDASDSE